jgi:hypothetical protein
VLPWDIPTRAISFTSQRMGHRPRNPQSPPLPRIATNPGAPTSARSKQMGESAKRPPLFLFVILRSRAPSYESGRPISARSWQMRKARSANPLLPAAKRPWFC